MAVLIEKIKQRHELVTPSVVFTSFTDTRTALRLFSLFQFLRATAGTAIARLSHRNSVCLSVCLSVRHTGRSGKNGAS